MSRTITAILKKRKLKTNWGFQFNTEIQSYVENAMLAMHFGSGDYWLSFTDEAPEGIYTNVDVSFNEETNKFTYLLRD